MGTTEHVQSVRNAWINRLRDEALRMKRTEVSKCVHIGILIGTYADADGTNAFPAGKTLAAIAGCTEETVTRCVKVLLAVGLLSRKRRPNQSSMYLLVVPMGKAVPWVDHLHLYTETRQARRKRDIKAQEVAAAYGTPAPEAPRNPLQNGVRNPFQDGGPEPVPAGDSGDLGTRSGTVPETVLERGPEPVPAGGDHKSPTSGRDPGTDHTEADVVSQPQVVAGASSKGDQGSAEVGEDGQPLRRCAHPGCWQPLVRPGTTRCSTHRDPLPGQRRRPARGREYATQSPLMHVVPAHVDAPAARPSFSWKPEDPTAPERLCGCGRSYRSRTDKTCQDCQYAAHQEAHSA